MKKKDLQRLREQLTAEFRLTQSATGLDVLAWYCDSQTLEAQLIRSTDTFDEGKASLRTAAAAAPQLMSRRDRATDAVAAVLYDRGLDVSKVRSRTEAIMASKRDWIEVLAMDTHPGRTERLRSDDGYRFYTLAAAKSREPKKAVA